MPTLLRPYQGYIMALLWLYYGSIKVLFNLIRDLFHLRLQVRAGVGHASRRTS